MKDKQKKTLVKFEISMAIRKALQLRAVCEDVDMRDVVNAALKAYLAPEIKEVAERGLVKNHADVPSQSERASRK